MPKTITTVFDPAEHLQTPEDIALFLNDMLENGSAEDIVHGLNIVARSVGMTKIAADSGMGRESLYKALGGTAKPEFATILKVMRAAGLKLQVAA